MDGLLSLKWNNHSSSFLRQFSILRDTGTYCDATIVCQESFFTVHKLVLSTCSDYFYEIFERTQCKHPFLIIKDVETKDMEILLNYMYKGEVNVLQNQLPNLIKAAEALKVKGLAVPDDEPYQNNREKLKKLSNSGEFHQSNHSHKRSEISSFNTSESKRIKKLEERKTLKEDGNLLKSLEKCRENQESTDLSQLFQNEVPNTIKEEPLEDGSNYEEGNSITMKMDDHNSRDSKTSEHSTPSSYGDSFYIAQTSAQNDENQDIAQSPLNQLAALQAHDKMKKSPSLDSISGHSEFSFASVLEDYSGNRNDFSVNIKALASTLDVNWKQCDLCSYRTPRSDHLTRHKNLKHFYIRPYPCSYCHSKFGQKSDLLRHLKIHENSNNHYCNLCEYKAVTKRALEKHILAVHSESFQQNSPLKKNIYG